MKYSFVIIAYNEEANIAACVNSVLSQQHLGQSYEVIVVDDGSKDETPKIVKKLAASNKKINLVSDGKNHGRGYSRYAGVKKSTGEYVIMVDADSLLPTDWLKTCLKHIKNYDAVGGIAVPDGDVTYIYSKLNLKPRVTRHTTTVSGGNGFYRREIFNKINFSKNLREGEDVDFNHKLTAAGFKAKTITNLHVNHNESKTFAESLAWMFESGMGASRQLRQFRQIRLPDLVFLGMVVVSVLAIVFAILVSPLTLLTITLFVLLADGAHFRGKFVFQCDKLMAYIAGWLVNSLLIFSYLCGRAVGVFKWLR